MNKFKISCHSLLLLEMVVLVSWFQLREGRGIAEEVEKIRRFE